MGVAFVGIRQVHIFTVVLTQIGVSVCWSRKLMSFECDVLVREKGVGWVCVHERGAIGMAVKSFASKKKAYATEEWMENIFLKTIDQF